MVTNGTSSTLWVPALRLPALPDVASPPPASQQNARVPLPAPGNDYHVSMDLTAEFAGIIDVSEEEAWLRARTARSGLAPDSARGVRRLSCASRHGDAGGHSRSR